MNTDSNNVTAGINAGLEAVASFEIIEDLKLETKKPLHSPLLGAAKRIVDIFISLTFLILFSWLYVVIWFCVLLSSGAPVFYWQYRYGRNGKEFRFYKFRSMVQNSKDVLDRHLQDDKNASVQWAAYQKLERDPRVTKFGSFIRKTSLDELPQFWNVLRGDMSIVGPRPCMKSQRSLYGDHWRYYVAVRPGITGLWQVSGRNKLTYSRRVLLDVEYVKRLSAKEDIAILAKTVYVVITGHGSL